MILSYKLKRILSLLIILCGLPLYIFAAVTLASLLGRQQILVELLIYIFLGVAWVFPFRFIFKGIGQSNPENK